MNLFLVLSILSVLLAIAVLARVLIRPAVEPHQEAGELLGIYKSRYAEIERDKNNGLLTETQYREACEELERSLVSSNLTTDNQARVTTIRPALKTTLFIAAFIPACTVLVYLMTGSPESLSANRQATAMQEAASGDIDVDAMIRQLEQRLEETPDDIRGWQMLTRSYLVLQRYEDAVESARRLNELEDSEPAFIVMYVDALLMANNGEFDANIRSLIDKSLSLAPEYPPVLWLAGMSAYQSGDFTEAASHWQLLYDQLDEESELRLHVEALLDDIGEKTGQ